MNDRGVITGALDGAALTELAWGGPMLAGLDAFELDQIELLGALHELGELPVSMRGADEDDLVYEVRAAAAGARAVAIAASGARTKRWVYLGVIEDRGCGGLSLGGCWEGSPWDGTVVAATANGAVRVVEHADHGTKAVLVDGGSHRVGVYVGFDGEDAVAIVLDAAGIGGLVDRRDREGRLRETQLLLAEATPGERRMDWPQGREGFLPNLAPGVPRFEDDLLSEQVSVSASLLGTLSLPSSTLGVWAGYDVADIWSVAGVEAEVLAFTAWRRAVAWTVRVPEAVAVSWTSFGFREDVCVVGDAGSGVADLRMVGGTWPHEALAFADSQARRRVLCARGVSRARAQLGFDASARVTAVVAIL